MGLTVRNGNITSDEKTLNVKIKEFGSTTDDIVENTFTGKLFNGLRFQWLYSSFRWITVKGRASNKVIFLNLFTGVHEKELIVDGTPDRMEFDFERELLLLSIKDTNFIAK